MIYLISDVNSLSYFRFEKGLETEMAWKRLFHTLKKIFSHNWPPVIAGAFTVTVRRAHDRTYVRLFCVRTGVRLCVLSSPECFT